MKIDNTIRFSLLTLAFIAVTWSLYVTRDILTPIALAIFIWLIIDGFARWLDGLSPKLPYWFALIIAVLTVIMGMSGIVLIIADTANDVIRESGRYNSRLQDLLHMVGGFFGQPDLDYGDIDRQLGITENLNKALSVFAGSIQGVLSNFSLIVS